VGTPTINAALPTRFHIILQVLCEVFLFKAALQNRITLKQNTVHLRNSITTDRSILLRVKRDETELSFQYDDNEISLIRETFPIYL